MHLAPNLTRFVRDGSWERLVHTMNALSQAMSTHYGKGRAGGVVTLFEQTGIFAVTAQSMIGTPDPQKIGRYQALSQEKALRAHSYGEMTSWTADRDPRRSRYGGAFMLPHQPVMISFAGWREIHDVMFNVLALERAGLLRPMSATTIFNWHTPIALELHVEYETFKKTFEAVPT